MNTTFLVTISPAPNRYNKLLKNPLSHLYTEDMLYLKQCLGKHISRCYMYPELDSKGRLHYHGIMSMGDHGKVSFYKSVKPRLERLGFVQAIVPKDHYDKLRWIHYCRKEWHITQRILDIEAPFLGKALVEIPHKKKKEVVKTDPACDFFGICPPGRPDATRRGSTRRRSNEST